MRFKEIPGLITFELSKCSWMMSLSSGDYLLGLGWPFF